ncbi:MAG: RNA polymerase sigma factor [Spirochaetota bacterium]|nr:RNA polymerase sigma factor [Spirochaetota bacterium]
MIKDEIEKISLEELLGVYRETKSKIAFDVLFSRCHKELLKFLLGKNLSVDDAEDLLQDYFISEFDKSIDRYELGSQRKFINYIKHIVLLRFFTLYKKLKYDKLHRSHSLDNPPEGYNECNFASDNNSNILMRDEIKDFFRDLLFSIKNEKHRNAVILKLCLPIKLSTDEISDLLECTTAAYSTWLFRGILELKECIEKLKDKLPFDFEEVLSFAREESFSLKRETLDQIKDDAIKEVLNSFLFLKKDYSEIACEINKSDDEIKSLLRKGIFDVLSLLNRREVLLRKGGVMYVEQDDVIQYIDSLDYVTSTNITTRKSLTTGDKELDNILSSIYLLFHEEQNLNTLSIKDLFLNKINELNLSIDTVRNECQLSFDEINQLLTDSKNINDKTLNKIKDFINIDYVYTKNSDSINDEHNDIINKKFQSMNQKLLNEYYQRKE